MKTIALFLAGALLTAPEDKPAIPDYFDGNGASAQTTITQCNLNGEDVNGPFKTCRYDCGRTLTVGARLVCPFVLQR
ncbi:hypothetical protein [Rhizobium herbae]|uniref:DUF3551 domain-containing protein n=1 Tax=Rhizobium herbae TaxID=508661 RepID=A0ABS4ERX7_9HYPH|nr:hypothetical protein [Rhizobium herbae]MBP1860694.1 hypothetical protein [Rhizobium herbae]